MVVLKYGIQTVIDNIGMPFEWVIILLLVVGCLIIAAKSVQLALMILMTTSGAVFAWFWQWGFEWTYPLIIMFMALVFLALTLYSTNATSKIGGYT